jgi:hypothetical protein
MIVDVVKKPEFENDDCLIKINNFYLSDNNIKNILNTDEYIKLKFQKFNDRDISKDGFEKFKDRPALRNFDSIKDMRGSIYTYACKRRNEMSYGNLLMQVKHSLENKSSRRNYIRICNSYSDYSTSHDTNLDVSCLSNIHYFENEIKLIFRASDIKNELFPDILSIYQFFIKPIYKKPIKISIYASTAQNIDYVNELVEKINMLLNGELK